MQDTAQDELRDGPIVSRDQQRRLDRVVPADAIAVLTQCARAYVEKASTTLAGRQQEHVNYVDARFVAFAAELQARSESTSRVLAQTHEAQAAIQGQLDGMYHHLAADVRCFIDQKLHEQHVALSGDLAGQVALYANEARSARDSSHSALALLQHKLIDKVRSDVHGHIENELARIRERIDSHLLQIHSSTKEKIDMIEKRVDNVVGGQSAAQLVEALGRSERMRLDDQVGRLRGDIGIELDQLRAVITEKASACEERTLMRTQDLIQDRVQPAIDDAKGLFESKIRATEHRLQQLVQGEAKRIATTLDVEQHLRVLQDHVDAQMRDATTALNAYLATSQLRAESKVTALIADRQEGQISEERVAGLICERVGAELQDVDERIDRKLCIAQKQIMIDAKTLFEELV